MFNSLAVLLGRILLALLFIPAAVSKLGSISGTAGYMGSLGLPAPEILVWLVIALELLGGIAVLIGFLTKPAAFALGIFSMAAGYIGHYGQGGDNAMLVAMNQQAFMKDIAIGGGFLVLGVFGPGALSLGAWLSRKGYGSPALA